MAYEKTVVTTVTRTVWEAKCACGDSWLVDKDPPREHYCGKCGKWCPYEPISYSGPDFESNRHGVDRRW